MNKHSIEEIFSRFDALNNTISHFNNTNDICTPMGCVQEMVDSLPKSFWEQDNLRILDSCCGNGNFHAYIQTKVPLKCLYFNEINEKRIANTKEYFGDSINLTQKDFLEFSNEQQFDLVVSNPPYAKFCGEKRASKNHNLSRPFIAKSLEITKEGGFILFIAPDNWMSFSDRNNLPQLMSRYQFHVLDIHGAKRWFQKVGSSFTWFLLQKVPNSRPFIIQNHYKIKDIVRAKIDKGVQCIPLYYNDTVRRLMHKTINSSLPKYPVETTSDLHRTTKKACMSNVQTDIHRYRLIHTPKQTVWSNRPHKYQKGWKVFISLSDRYKVFIDNCGMTQSIAFIRCSSKKEALRIKEELECPVYRAINNLTRYGNFNNIRVLQRLPRLPHINLTKKETVLVNYFSQVL